MSNNFYYVVKEVGSKARVSGCPACKEREKAERFLEGMLSVM